MKKSRNASASAGIDVRRDSLIWLKISDPAAATARLAVSESGDALSPKYEPEMTAPAVIASDRSILAAMPISPMPMVPTTVQELPIARAMTAQISAALA